MCTVKSEVSVYRYLSGTLRPLGSYTGNDNVSSYYVKARLSPDGNFLASGSPTDSVCIWDVSYPGAPIARLKVRNRESETDACHERSLAQPSPSHPIPAQPSPNSPTVSYSVRSTGAFVLQEKNNLRYSIATVSYDNQNLL